MGALFGSSRSSSASKTVQQKVPEPEKVAEPARIGDTRKIEDEQLFGGQPDLRVTRTATPPSLETSGSGLKLM